jgi:transposase-like protein
LIWGRRPAGIFSTSLGELWSGPNERSFAGVVEVDKSSKLGRIRLAMIADASSDSLDPFVKDNVEPGSTVITDGWSRYLPSTNAGFLHVIKPMKGDKSTLSHAHRAF